MVLLIVLVFVGVFTVVALLIVASGSAAAGQSKQVLATLDSALASDIPKSRAPIVDFRKSELLSAIPWVNRGLLKSDLVPNLQRLLNQANLKWTVGVLLLLCAACFALPAYLIDLKTGSVLGGLLGGLVLGFLPYGYVRFLRSRRFGKFEEGLPDALELMVSALRVGHSFSAALGLVTRECADPIGCEFRICFDEQNFGLELRTALENMIARVPLQDLRIVVTAILIQRESGGNLAEVLEKTAYVTRQRFRLKKQVMVHTAQGRLTGWVLTLLPVALGIGLYIINPETMSLLWKTSIGIKLLCGAGCMLVIGTLVIQKIVHMEV
jgi:tight adherence protein B